MGKKYPLTFLLLIFLALYFYVYFRLIHFVYFNYDMPLQAFRIQDFIKEGTFLTAQYFSEESVWRNISWGPTAIFFYAFFLKMSNDPLTVSYLLSILNLFSIFFVIFFMWRYFSRTAGVISGFLLAFNIYWVTYSRLIYVPSPVTFFIPLSMLLFFKAVFERKWWAQILLPVSWVALIQVYLPTYAFILSSIIVLVFNIRKINIKYFGFGIIFALILLLPTIVFYQDRSIYAQRIIEAPSLFTPQEKTFIERLGNVAKEFVQVPVGGGFENQTFYAFHDFIKLFPEYFYVNPVLTIIFLLSLLLGLFKIIRTKDYKLLALFLWSIAPLWSMVVLWVSDIRIRYFLIAFPATTAIIALFFTELIKLSKYLWILPICVVVYYVNFNVFFNSFVKNYNYPNGRFGDATETPYFFLKGAVAEVVRHADSRNCTPIITNNNDKPDFDVMLETKYVWQYVFNKKMEVSPDSCHYLIDYRYKFDRVKDYNYKNFGIFGVKIID